MTKVSETFELYGKTYTLETGEVAKQATGSVVIKQGDTMVLVTAVVSNERKDFDFFPLTVDFVERMYAVGRIPGGYLKREARPTDKATLTARMIDRPIRPSFPDGFRNEVQIVGTVFSADQEHAPDVISITGASAALMVGGVPFEGPIAGVRIGRDRDTGEFLVNPTYEERDNSDLDLEMAGTRDFISMVEAGADEVPEDIMLEAMAFGQEAIAAFCDAQERFASKVDIEMKEYPVDEPDMDLRERIQSHAYTMSEALKNPDKHAREAAVADVKDQILAGFDETEIEQYGRALKAEMKELEKHAMRTMVVETGVRVDGRKTDEIRPITVDPDYIPLVHGSGMFTRGQTQVISVLTLGMLNEWQRLDTIEPIDGKRYLHHYNFPPYCTGETGRMGTPKRREIGHGNLAERALLPVLPDPEDFPYTMRVVSEVTESNGSSSMASACGSTLALMDGGVPIKRPVSGIAMGLIQEGDKTAVLSDIQGVEDFLGDMDFKVCGTSEGITALQMDNKAKGLTLEVLGTALEQAKAGRAHILDKMLAAQPESREGTKENAPHIVTISIPVDKIREVIGSGGKVIRGIQEDTGATIDIQEDGTVFIASVDSGGEEARKRIEAIVKVPEPGEDYYGRVVGIQPFGAFVELLPGKDGLLHISRVAKGRVENIEDALSVGDEVHVTVLEVDEKGKISLDRLDKPEAPASKGGEKRRDDDRRSGGKPRSGGDRRPGDGGEGRKPRRRHS